MDWRVAVIDEKRFCIVGTFDLTFAECRQLSDRRGPGMVRIPERRLVSIGSFEVPTDRKEYTVAVVRGEQFYKRDADGTEHAMLHVIVSSESELSALRSTGRFREWDADLRKQHSSAD